MPFQTIKPKNNKAFSLFMLLFSLIFYLFFAFYDGAVICVDSPTYISMEISREPFYPMFLAFFRWIFSGFENDFYLTAAVFVQSILAAAAAWSLAAFLKRSLQLSSFLSVGILLIPMAVSLLCRFAARRGSMYSNSILTEGITISCYLFFFRYLSEYLTEHTRKSFVSCCVLSFLLISTRKQMAVSLAMLVTCICIGAFQRKNFRKGLASAFLWASCILFSSSLLDLGYNYVLRGEMARHSGDTRFITTMAFYTAERSDAGYIEDEEIRNLFLKIYDTCEEKGFLKHSAGTGWLNRVSHFGDHYDHIQIDTMWPLVNEFASNQLAEGKAVSDELSSGSEARRIADVNKNADRVMDIINRSIIPHNIPKVLATFTDNFLSGLVTTVARRNPLLTWYSLCIYLVYLALLLYHIRTDRQHSSQNAFIILFSSLTLLSVLLNVGLVSLVIFCQTRYTIYNMALFYISLLLMAEPVFTRMIKGKAGRNNI